MTPDFGIPCSHTMHRRFACEAEVGDLMDDLSHRDRRDRCVPPMTGKHPHLAHALYHFSRSGLSGPDGSVPRCGLDDGDALAAVSSFIGVPAISSEISVDVEGTVACAYRLSREECSLFLLYHSLGLARTHHGHPRSHRLHHQREATSHLQPLRLVSRRDGQ